MTQKNSNPWTFDVRVRERNLKSGNLNDKDVEKYLSGLTDLADQAEPFGTPQPALEQPIVEAADDLDDEDDEDDDDEDEVQEEAPQQHQPAQPEAAAEVPAATPPSDVTPE